MLILNLLKRYIKSELIIPDIQVTNKAECVEKLIDLLYLVSPEAAGDVSKTEAFNAIMGRENAQSTGIGEGKAFPHARLNGWKDFTVCFAHSKNGIDFNSLDGQPAHFIFLMFSSENEPYIILKSMANIIKLIARVESAGGDVDEQFPLDIADTFKKEKSAMNKIVEAEEIMTPLKTIVRMDDPLTEVIKYMHLEKIDVLPVVDEQDKLKGQISCHDIFAHEVPDFFKRLHTVSFVRNFDPFENYFKLEKSLKVKDYLKNGCVTIDCKATLVEIIFLLTIKDNNRLFVLRDEKLVGIIDRFSILDRILFF